VTVIAAPRCRPRQQAVPLARRRPARLSPDGHVLGAVDRVATGTYIVRPHGRAMVAGYFGGALARGARGGRAGGDGGVRRRRARGAVRRGDPAGLGFIASFGLRAMPSPRLYSFALPGHSGDRRGSQRRSTTASILRARRARRTISRPRTAPSSPVSRRPMLSPTTSEG